MSTLTPFAAFSVLALLTAGCPSASTPNGGDGSTVDDADSAAVSDTAAPGAALRVVSLNLRCLIDDWDARLPILVDGLAAVDPDVLGLQEVCAEPGVRDALPELLAGLAARTGRTYATHRAVTHRAWDTYDEGLAIASALPLEAAKTVALPAGTFPRKVLLARLTLPGGGTVAFATTHLDHQSTATRKTQAAAVATATAGYREDAEPLVLTGDFNEGPAAGEVHATLADAGFTDVWAALYPGEVGNTFPSSNPTGRIDYVWLVPADGALAPRAITRILTEAVGGVRGSDHLGLAAELDAP